SDLVDSRNALGAGRQLFLPNDLACVLVISADLTVGRGGSEHETAGGDHYTSTREVRPGIAMTLIFKGRDTAVGDLPFDGAGIQVIRGHSRPRRTDRRKAVALEHEIDRRCVVDETGVAVTSTWSGKLQFEQRGQLLRHDEHQAFLRIDCGASPVSASV